MTNTTEDISSEWLIKNGIKWYHHFCINILKAGPIPRHVAFIMDGNRRYATKTNVALRVGHTKGFDKFSQIIYWSAGIGMKEITVYAFSIENFNRSPIEVDTLMKLATEKIDMLLDEIDDLNKNGLCIRVIGNLQLLPDDLKARIAQAVLLTKNNDKLVVNIAFSYTSQDEIANAFKEIGEAVRKNIIEECDINEQLISKCMYSCNSRKVDILIRTSGEVRFSDFLLWQSSNTNVIFHKVLWPDFTVWHLMACIFYYQMYYSDQKRVEKLCSIEYDDRQRQEVATFLIDLEKRRIDQLETYASHLTQNVAI